MQSQDEAREPPDPPWEISRWLHHHNERFVIELLLAASRALQFGCVVDPRTPLRSTPCFMLTSAPRTQCSSNHQIPGSLNVEAINTFHDCPCCPFAGHIQRSHSRGPNEKSHNPSPPRKKNETSCAGQRECPDHDQDAVGSHLHNYEK